LAFYADGKLKEKTVKTFETKFLETDSMLVGHTGSKKNERMSTGVFDDIKIFHRSLSDKEVLELYNAPNPNELKNLINEILKYGLIVLVSVIIIIVIIIINKRALKKQKEKLELSNKLSDMELKMVKAQMNPHFVFNSLNSIKHFVMKKENDKAEMYLSKFAKLTRGLLESSTKESLTVKEEIEIITGYLEMESLRFGKSFTYMVDVDAAINQESTHIPHMMIQPFVENAIWHGLLNKEDDRILNVSFTLESNNSITCVVDDNGIGRAKSSQKEITFKKTSLALSFVTRRLELMRETLKINCSVNIVDKVNNLGESEGTKVVIVLPILKGLMH
jgi:LytS/YehU family sensor histidine kinase